MRSNRYSLPDALLPRRDTLLPNGMFDIVCDLPLTSDLFGLAAHPTRPVVAVGLAGGHVQTLRLPPIEGEGGEEAEAEAEADLSALSNGTGVVESVWRTRRHKGSCRALGWSTDGRALFSAGTDGVVKGADAETGRVTSKIGVPDDASTGNPDEPSLLHVLSPQTLLLATDNSALHLFDLRQNLLATNARPSGTYYPHDDYISSLTPLPPSEASTSGFPKQWVSTGGSTLAVTDLRRGVLVRSEDQEEELLSSVFVGGLGARGTSKGEKVLVGGAGGVITMWERGVWDDQDERIVVDKGVGGGESIDSFAVVPDALGMGKMVAAGMGDGRVKLVKLGANKVVAELRHDEAEGVGALAFDVGGRLISGGGTVIRVWHEKMDVNGDDDEDDSDSDADDRAAGKRRKDSDDSDSDSDSDDGGRRRRKKKKKGSKGKAQNGILKFSGLD